MVRFFSLLWQDSCEQDVADCSSGNLILLYGGYLRMKRNNFTVLALVN